MVRKRFRRPSRPLEEPAISIRQGRFHYNAVFARLTELERRKAVIYHLDDDFLEIAFEFLSEAEEEDAYRVENRGGMAKFRSSAHDLIKRTMWVRSVVNPRSGAPKTYRARRDGKLWTIRLCPAFECSVKRADVLQIASTATGIYRYVNGAGTIVYIGKGSIRKRAQEEERLEWSFETIEYSLVPKESQQSEWESYWIDLFTADTHGELPAYNRQAGNMT